MPTKLENAAKAMGKISAGLELFNAVFPNIVGVVLTLKNGKKINLQELIDDTEKFAQEKIDEANEFLDRPGE